MSFKAKETKILNDKKRSFCNFIKQKKTKSVLFVTAKIEIKKKRSFCKFYYAESFFSFVPKYIKLFYLKKFSGEKNKNNWSPKVFSEENLTI